MQNGVAEAQIRRIYRETVDPLYGYISRRCAGDRDLTEDITQDTWLRAVRTWRRDGVPERPLAWLTTVAHNLLMNHFRRRPFLSLDADTTGPLVAGLENGTGSTSTEVADVVRQALARLPSRESRLLEAFHYDRHRVAEIAAMLGISERAVEGRLRRARRNLRGEIETILASEGGIQ